MTTDERIENLLKVQERSLVLYQTQGNEIRNLGSRVQTVEETLDRFSTIHSGQARILRRLAGSRIRELLPTEESYKKLRSQYYSWLWHRYQDAFGITSYLDTRLKHFEAACDYIREWQPLEAVSSSAS